MPQAQWSLVSMVVAGEGEVRSVEELAAEAQLEQQELEVAVVVAAEALRLPEQMQGHFSSIHLQEFHSWTME
jgi:hypothetical protein